MLKITVAIGPEGWNEEKQEFVEPKYKVLQLEHSLISLSKWESKWKKPFLSKFEMTDEEIIDYIRCMTVTPNVDPEVYLHLSNENIREVQAYIEDPMTATTFSNVDHRAPSREIITSEIIYYWMIAYQIPIDREKWHLNRLLTLIQVCDRKNNPPKKRSKRDIMRRNAELNAIRRNKLGTRG